MISTKVKQEILSRIKPSKEESKKLKAEADELLSLISLSAKELNIDCKPFIGGSFGKGTYLRDSFDVDIFCRFDLKYKDKDLSGLAKSLLEHVGLTFATQKGSRDYFSGDFNSLHFELVPNYHITSLNQAKNSTDYSPYHVEFVQHHANHNLELLDEIRLTKQFFKAQGIYGAESYINGFSGHVIDLLIIYYGSLKAFLESVKTWGEKTCLDVAKFYSSEEELLRGIDSAKHSNLVVVDSILKERNASKALNEENYFKLLALVLQRENFSKEDFIIEKRTFDEVILEKKTFAKKHDFHIIQYYLELGSIDSEDIVGSKLLKVLSKLDRYYATFDFLSFDSSFDIFFNEKKCCYTLFFETNSLPKLKLLKGPEVFRSEALLAFSKAKGDIFVKGNRVYAYESREITCLNKVPLLTLDSFKRLSSRDMSFIKKLSSKIY